MTASRGLEDKLGYRFKDAALLREALTHKSYASEHAGEPFNERLEFLGDSVLAAVTAHKLFTAFPNENEGKLSKLKALLVSRATLAVWAGELDLGSGLRLGAGEEAGGGRERQSNLANAMEAVLGAMYLDGGYEPVRRLIGDWFERTHDGLDESDHKSRLQELLQKKHKAPPQYELSDSTGPDHDKTFTVAVVMHNKTLGTGEGKSKKEAEQAAARDALERLAAQERGK